MALVAYSDDSDLGSDSEDIEEHVNGIKGESKPKITPEVIKEKTPLEVQCRASPDVKQKPMFSSTLNDIVEDDEGYAIDKPSILASIPAALPVDSTQNADEIGEVEDELTDVPTVDTWKVTAEIKKGGSDGKPQSADNLKSKAKSLIKKKEKSKVQFFVPALSEFDDDDEEDEQEEEPERKKLKPSSKGTGLFSVLPEPKHLSVKETKRSLIPHILTKAPVQKPPKPKPALEKKPVIQSNDSDEEQDLGPSDFFSLSEYPADIGAVAETPMPALKTPIMDVQTSSKHLPKAAAVVEDARHVCNEQMPTEHVSNPQHEEPSYTFQVQETHSGNPSDMDEEAMIRLMGKRRRKGEEINFINVNADDALLSRDEWMTKALSEEKPSYSFSKKREGLPSQKQKQKHQITFLAHQAKERELELKNNWADNRMTKMQTQAKYGF